MNTQLFSIRARTASMVIITTTWVFLLLLTGSASAQIFKLPPILTGPRPTELMIFPLTHWSTSHDLYTVNADGTGLKALTDTPENECHPAWSPDGKQIAFARAKGGHIVIAVMNADGGGVRDLMEPDLSQSVECINCTPAWSPDGKQIAFGSNRDGNHEIYVMGADGSDPRNITNNPAADAFPAWSPDGKKIAFNSNRSGNMQVCLCDTDGSNLRWITSGQADHRLPTWSADGTKLLVTSQVAHEMPVLQVVDVQSLEKTPLDIAESGMWGVWSPDETRIAFLKYEEGSPRLAVVDRATKTNVQIDVDKDATGGLSESGSGQPEYSWVSWAPDGKKFVFAFGRGPSRNTSALDPPSLPYRLMYLGAHGEFFTTSAGAPLNANEIRIAPLDGGFALVHTGPKWSGTYAIVHPDCRIEIVTPPLKDFDLSSAAEIWPYRSDKGLPALPPYKSIIVGDQALMPPSRTPPEGMLGRVLLCADGDFYWPSPQAPMIANTIWVVKWNDTFQFVKETEDSRQEVYASVYPNREIVFAPNTYTGPKRCWTFEDINGKVIYWQGDGDMKGSFGTCDEDQIILTVHPNGGISGSFPEIP